MSAVASAVVSAVANRALSGSGRERPDPSVARAQESQAKLLEQQRAAQTRLQQQTDEREAELSGQLASQRRALASRSRGRNSLSFAGASTSLKSTLGG